VIRAALGIKAWIAKTPCVDEVRPVQCVACKAASRPVGGPLVIHGHGLLARQVRGVLDVDSEPGTFLVWVRRYACQLCKAVMTVLPAEMLARRQYWGRTRKQGRDTQLSTCGDSQLRRTPVET
jgi:hypothetical protein